MSILDSTGIEWTTSQIEAMDISKNIAVTAGAGSGKTQVLAARYMLLAEKLLSEKGYVGPERILVLTFTEKAAAEMKERITKVTNDYIGGDDFKSLGDNMKRKWIRFRHELHKAEISTIHAFCARTIRRYPIESHVDPEFSVIENFDQRTRLEETILNEISRRARVDDKELEVLLKVWNSRQVKTAIEFTIDKRDALSDWVKRYTTLSIDEIAAGHRLSVVTTVKGGLKKLITDENTNIVRDMTAYEALKPLDNDTLDIKRQTLKNAWDRCAHVIRTDGDIDYDAIADLTEVLLKSDGKPRSFGRVGAKSVWGEAGKEFFKDCLSNLADKAASVFYELTASFKTMDRDAIEVLKALAAVSVSVSGAYIKSKEKTASLDFADLETITEDLLSTHPEIRIRLSEAYRYIMVDEFQDTNETQWEIIKNLSTKENGQMEEDKLFLVGDEKQAIYSFRGGDVETFAKARRLLAGGDGDSDLTKTYRKVTFKENFRSSEKLICFYNEFFSNLMGQGDLKDYEAEFESLKKANDNISYKGNIEAHLYSKCDRAKGLGFESEIVATSVQRLLEDVEFISASGSSKPKIAILLRRMTDVKVYEDVLRRSGIDFATVKGRGFYQRQEIYDIYNILAFLTNTSRDIELLGILRSPALGLSDDEVFDIAGKGKGTLWERLAASDFGIAKEIVSQLSHWLFLKDRNPTAKLIRQILNDTHLYLSLGYGRRASQKVANIEKLISIARQFDGFKQGLSGFVDFLEYQMANEDKEGEADIPVDSDVVLMTVHQSKGLQFPAVIIPDLNGRFNLGSESLIYMGNIGGNTELGIRMPDPDNRYIYDQTYLRKVIAKESRVRDLAEQKRLLYVAATRAQYRLIAIGQASQAGDLPASDYYDLNSWSDWLCKVYDLPALLSVDEQHTDEAAASIKSGEIDFLYYDIDKLEERAITPDFVLAQTAVKTNEEEASTEGIFEFFADMDDKVPSRKKISRVRRKRRLDMSATSVMDYLDCPLLFFYKHRIGMQDRLTRDRSIRGQLRIDGAKLGTIFHDLMSSDIYNTGDEFSRIVRGHMSSEDLNQNLYGRYLEILSVHLENLRSMDLFPHIYADPDLKRYNEVQFAIDIPGQNTVCGDENEIRFNGFIDRLVEVHPGTWRIYDFKTNDLSSKDAAEYSSQSFYDVQMQLYIEMANMAFARAGRDIRVDDAFLIYTGSKAAVHIEPNPKVLGYVHDVEKSVATSTYAPRSQEKCQGCGYEPICGERRTSLSFSAIINVLKEQP